MVFFVDKLAQLADKSWPEHFRNLCFQTLCLHRLGSMLGQREYVAALAFVKEIHEPVLMSASLHKTDRQLQLLLLAGQVHFFDQQYDKANRYVSRALNEHKPLSASVPYRACRLLHIVIHYETENSAYLDYDIRAYKRFYSQFGRASRVEKLLFKTIQLNPGSAASPGRRRRSRRSGRSWKRSGRTGKMSPY